MARPSFLLSLLICAVCGFISDAFAQTPPGVSTGGPDLSRYQKPNTPQIPRFDPPEMPEIPQIGPPDFPKFEPPAMPEFPKNGFQPPDFDFPQGMPSDEFEDFHATPEQEQRVARIGLLILGGVACGGVMLVIFIVVIMVIIVKASKPKPTPPQNHYR